ncbi:hypothetical protein D3C86_2173610 [compost metagenome]
MQVQGVVDRAQVQHLQLADDRDEDLGAVRLGAGFVVEVRARQQVDRFVEGNHGGGGGHGSALLADGDAS